MKQLHLFRFRELEPNPRGNASASTPFYGHFKPPLFTRAFYGWLFVLGCCLSTASVMAQTVYNPATSALIQTGSGNNARFYGATYKIQNNVANVCSGFGATSFQNVSFLSTVNDAIPIISGLNPNQCFMIAAGVPFKFNVELSSEFCNSGRIAIESYIGSENYATTQTSTETITTLPPCPTKEFTFTFPNGASRGWAIIFISHYRTGDVFPAKFRISIPFLVTGIKTSTVDSLGRFTSPKIPSLVLHVPPGDGSSSQFSKVGRNCRAYEETYAQGSSTQGDLAVKFGVAGNILGTIAYEFSTTYAFSHSEGNLKTQAKSNETCVEVEQVFSTDAAYSNGDKTTDLFIGDGYDESWGIGDNYVFNPTICNVEVKKSLVFAPIASTIKQFRFTEEGIRSDMAEQQRIIDANPVGSKIRVVAEAQKKVWQQVIDNNNATKANPNLQQLGSRINFSAGTTSSTTTATQSTSSNSLTVDRFVDGSNAVSFAAIVGASGVQGDFTFSSTKQWGQSTTTTTETLQAISYTLNDNDQGDIFNVDVFRDPRFGTPIFRLVGGTASSCPYEGGDRRNIPFLQGGPNDNTLDSVSTTITAARGSMSTFAKLQLCNRNKNEARTYKLVLAENPEGAGVTFGSNQTLSQSVPAESCNTPIRVNITRPDVNSPLSFPLTFELQSDCADGSGDSVYVLSVIAEFSDPIPPIIVSAPSVPTQTVCNGGQSAISVTASGGTGDLTYQWYINTVNSTTGGTSFATGSSITPASIEGTRYYYCVVGCTDGSCPTVTSSVAQVTFNINLPVLKGGLTNANTATNTSNNPLVVTTAVGSTSTSFYLQLCNNSTVAKSYVLNLNPSSNINNATVTASGLGNSQGINVPAGGCNTPILVTVRRENAALSYPNLEFQLSSADCSDASSSFFVTVNFPQIITVSPPSIPSQSACLGSQSAISITASGGTGDLTYQWYINTVNSTTGGTPFGGINGTVARLVPGAIEGTSYYYCVVGCTDGSCATVTSSVAAVTLSPTPIATISGSLDVCSGYSSTLTASGGASGATYLWSTGETTASITISPTSSTSYRVTVSNNNGCSSAISRNVKVFGSGVLAVNSPTICAGSPTTLTATGGSTYLWSTGETTASITVNPITSTAYRVTVHNVCTAVLTSNVTVNQPLVAAPTTANNALNFVAANSNAVEIQNCSNAPLSISNAITIEYWFKGTSNHSAVRFQPNGGTFIVAGWNGTHILSNDGDIAGISAGNVNDNNWHHVAMTWQQGAANGFKSYLDGNLVTQRDAGNTPLPSISSGIYLGSFNGGSEFMNGTLDNVRVWNVVRSPADLQAGMCNEPSSTAGLLMYYKFNHGSNGGNNSAINNILNSASSDYVGVLRNFAKTGTTSNFIASTTAQSTACEGVLNVSEPTNATQILCSNAATAAMSVTAGGGTGSFTYQWYVNANNSNTGGTLIPNANTATYTPPATLGTNYYYCVVNCSDGSCTAVASSTARVTVNQRPTVTVNSPTICAGITTTLNANGGSTYLWSTGATSSSINVSPTTNTSYSVTATDENGCTNTATSNVTVNAAPNGSVNSPSICSGNTATLNASGGSTYLWSTGATSSSINVSPTSNTNYSVTITNGSGCTQVLTSTVTVGSTLTATVNSPTICAGATATLTASNGASYLWSNGATSQSINVSPNSNTNYSVTVTNGSGCSGSATATVTVNQKPTVTVNSPTICAGVVTTLNANGGSTYLWSTGATTPSVNVNPTTNTSYSVTATDGNGCTNTATSNVTVNALPNGSVNSPSICSGSQATLTASGGLSYLWSNGATSQSINVSPTSNTNYSVTITNGSGCTQVLTSTVTVGSTLTATVNSPTICAGATATLTASNGASYLWSNGATSQSINVSPNSNTNYSVTVTNGSGCSGSATSTVTVNQRPTVTVNSPTICAGITTTLNANGGSTYLWSTGATTSSVSVSPTSNTSYSVTATDGNGCTNTATSNVTVNALPNGSVNSPSICSGNTATLNASGGSTYLWSTGATSSSINVSPTNNTNYSVTITNGSGCTQVLISTVTVNSNLAVSVNSPTICAGNQATLTASNGASYSWSNGATTQSINVSPNLNTNYSVTVTNGSGCSGTATSTVTVNSGPVLMVNSPTICVGASATLTASGGSNYTWNTGGNSSSINVNPNTTTTYTVSSTGANGCVSTASAVVRVNPLPVVSVNSPTVCGGGTTTLTASGGVSYAWSNGATGNPITINAPTTATNFTVTVTDANGCSNTAISTVSLGSNLVASVNSASVCAGVGATLTASGGSTYLWSTGETTPSVFVSPTTNTDYRVTVTNGGCSGVATATVSIKSAPSIGLNSPSVCAGSSATLIASGGSNYQWSTGSSGNVLTVNPTNSTSYSVTATGANGCTGTASTLVTVNPLPRIFTNSIAMCAGTNATLTATSIGNVNFQWSTGATTNSIIINPTTSTSYGVMATDMNGCSNSAVVSVLVNQPPSVNVTNTAICAGTNATLTATGGSTYVWSTGSTSNQIIVSPTSSTNYYVTATDGNGCKATGTGTVQLNPAVNLMVNSPAICVGSQATLTVSGASNYMWNTGSFGSSITVNPTNTTSYWVSATNSFGCTGSVSTSVTVNPLPNIIVPSPSICSGATANLLATGATSYLWSTGATSASINVNPLSTTNYSVTGRDANGCSNTAVATVSVNAVPAIGLNSAVICAGEVATLTANGGSTYLWSTGATTPSVNVTPTTTTNYSVTVTNASGCVASGTTTVTMGSNCGSGGGSNPISLTIKIFLEGCYDATNHKMKDDLRSQNRIPTNEPYAGLSNVNFGRVNGGGETTTPSVIAVTGNNAVVDWVMIELRDVDKPTTVLYTRAALLQADGDVVEGDGVSALKFTGLPTGEYIVAIKHRNHLRCRTLNPVALTINRTTPLNFTNNSVSLFGTNPLKQVETGVFALHAGDVDGNGVIDAADRSGTWNNRNATGYNAADCSLNGSVEATDRSQIWNNRNKTSNF